MYTFTDRDNDIVASEDTLIECLEYMLNEMSFHFTPYKLEGSNLIINSQKDVVKLLLKIKQKGNIMTINHQNVQAFYNDKLQLDLPKLKKYVVITGSYRFCGTYKQEQEALEYIENEVKNDSKERFYILEAKKEVGVKTPEMQIEEL